MVPFNFSFHERISWQNRDFFYSETRMTKGKLKKNPKHIYAGQFVCDTVSQHHDASVACLNLQAKS